MDQIRITGIAFLAALVGAPGASAQTYDLPFKGEDLRDDERVFWGREIHSDGGVQKFGYDLNVMRHDDGVGWVATKGGRTDNRNWHVYNRPVYAMRDGKVIACWRNAPENTRTPSGDGKLHEELTKHPGDDTRIYGGGNGFWIEHADGTRAEYAHFRPGTANPSLCRNREAALLPRVIDSPRVRDAWRFIRVPPADQVQVRAGQFLGRVGNSGTSSEPHLHVHVERGGTVTATKKVGGEPVDTPFRRGLAARFRPKKDPFGGWASFAGRPIPSGPRLIWPPRTVVREYTRFGLPKERFQALFDHLADSGFQPAWIDGYSVGKKGFFNMIWRPAERPWIAFAMISEDRYQREFDKALANGLEPIFVDSATLNGKPVYSVVFARNVPGSFLARHGRSRSSHEQIMNQARTLGLVPVNVSVVSIGGRREYTVLYRSGSIGDWKIRSRTHEDGFQKLYDAQRAAGRRPLYLNGYMHDGKPFVSAVFGKLPTPEFRDRHSLSRSKLQNAFDDALRDGLLSRAITAFNGAKVTHRYAASWSK